MSQEIRAQQIKLVELRSAVRGEAYAKYEVSYQNALTKNIITEQMELHVREGQGAAVAMTISGCLATTPEQAMLKLADWLEGFAFTLREKSHTEVQIPLL